MKVARIFFVLAGLSGVAAPAAGGATEPMPVIVRSAPGRFEVAARDGLAAHAVVARAEETWRSLEGPLGLPAAFSTPVFVRLTEEAGIIGQEAYRAVVEPGGVVTVWIRWPGEAAPSGEVQSRALVRGLLLRLAVATHGVSELAELPRWLEAGAAEWCETRRNPAQLDALKHDSEELVAPALGELLADARGTAGMTARAHTVAAVWLVTFLQAESTGMGEWAAFLRRLLAGERADVALPAAFPGRFASPRERELWWTTGWHHLRRGRVLPTLEPAESRAEIAQLARFVYAPGEEDVVVPLRTVLLHDRDRLVVAELRRRGVELERLTLVMHPFYRNAALSLAVALDSVRLIESKRVAAVAQFEADWRDAVELEFETRAALDRLAERQRR